MQREKPRQSRLFRHSPKRTEPRVVLFGFVISAQNRSADLIFGILVRQRRGSYYPDALTALAYKSQEALDDCSRRSAYRFAPDGVRSVPKKAQRVGS